ncbi:hypothetical protein, partial [Helicobacter bizzozeronii]|uniref:hypothetical protein n=1 Tax=Helicobacter bizzozeronii TaxID=56877 RepID=UPI0025556E54
MGWCLRVFTGIALIIGLSGFGSKDDPFEKSIQEDIVELRQKLEELPKKIFEKDTYYFFRDFFGIYISDANNEALRPIREQYEKHLYSLEDWENNKKNAKKCNKYIDPRCLRDVVKAIVAVNKNEQGVENITAKTAETLAEKVKGLETRRMCLDSGISYFSRLVVERLEDLREFYDVYYEFARRFFSCYAETEDLSKEYEDKYKQLQKMRPAVERLYREVRKRAYERAY